MFVCIVVLIQQDLDRQLSVYGLIGVYGILLILFIHRQAVMLRGNKTASGAATRLWAAKSVTIQGVGCL